MAGTTNSGNPMPNLPPKGRGRPPGTPNKVGKQAKDNIIAVFDQLGGVETMVKWARRNKAEFYRLYARLIPVTVHAAVDVRHASEFSDDELARIVASSGGERVVSTQESEPLALELH
jgi:hypothetical protein